jgi:hypothetical protein
MSWYANSGLNLAWASLSLTAFVWLFVYALRCGSRTRGLASRSVALFLIAVSLFPCVSASDDDALLAYANSQNISESDLRWSSHAKHSSDDNLATLVSLLEVLESAQSAIAIVLAITLSLFVLAVAIVPRSLDGLLPSCAGRAPPAFLSL